jgi:hypothetical protein
MVAMNSSFIRFAFTLADVADDELREPPPLPVEMRCADLHREKMAVIAPKRQLDPVLRQRAGYQIDQTIAVFLHASGRKEVAEVPSDHMLRRDAEHPLHRLISQMDGPVLADDRHAVRRDLCEQPVSLLVLAQRLLRLLALGDVALRSPNADHSPVFHNADQVCQKVFRIPEPIDPMHFGVRQLETCAFEGEHLVYVPWVRPDDQIADPRAYNLICGLVAVKPRHHIVAFGEVGVFEDPLNLFVFRQVDRIRRFHFVAPDRFRTVRDEGAVTLLALPQTFHRPGLLNRLPASVSHFRDKIDFPRLPTANHPT